MPNPGGSTRHARILSWLTATLLFLPTMQGRIQAMADAEQRFAELSTLGWQEALSDPCTQDWTTKWTLDGERAVISNTPEGMVFSAGLVAQDHASHAVLWTRDSFSGDIKIEFDYDRLDTVNRYVNIIYIQATGTGKGPYTRDIADWPHLRTIPYMRTYFTHMNLLHVSFAAYGSEEADQDYVRARRYPVGPDLPFSEIAVPPDYFDTGLFEPGVRHHFTILKVGHQLHMKVETPDDSRLFTWDTSGFDPVAEGRIGLRHMWTRCSRYANFRVFVLAK